MTLRGRYITLSLPCGEEKREDLVLGITGKSSLIISAKPVDVGGCVTAIDFSGQTIWIADAHRSDGKHFVVRADDKPTAFLELERAICIHVLHRTVQELKSTATTQEAAITKLKSTLVRQQKDFQATAAHQQKQIEALTAGWQKVSAQLEASRTAPQVVNNR